jgi:hypothetical protein
LGLLLVASIHAQQPPDDSRFTGKSTPMEART